jgi:hypothetical protein
MIKLITKISGGLVCLLSLITSALGLKAVFISEPNTSDFFLNTALLIAEISFHGFLEVN